MSGTWWIPIIVALLGGGGAIGFIVALLKIRPEAGQIVVNAAEGAVVVQASVIKNLHEENDRLRERVSTLEQEREQDRQRISMLERRLSALRVEVEEDREAGLTGL